MSKLFITYGARVEENLGAPSLLLGFYELLKTIYGNGFQMINLQDSPVPPEAAGMPFQTLFIRPYRAKEYFKTLLRTTGKAPDGKNLSEDATEISISEVFSLVCGADAVINLYGICFCDNFPTDSAHLPLVPLYAILGFGSIGAAWATTLVYIINSALGFSYMCFYFRRKEQ